MFKLLKQSYVQIHNKNVPIYGIAKSKNLSDFVTTEGDVKKGKTRIPLKLARVYDEDLLSEEPTSNSGKTTSNTGMEFDDAEMADQNDIADDLQHK